MAQSKKQKKEAAAKRAKQRARNAAKPVPATRVALEDQISNLQSALFNLRQMYDAAMQEKSAVQAAVVQRDQLITAFAVEYSGISVKKLTVDEIARGDWVGYEQEMEDDEMFVFAIHKNDLEEEVEDAGTEDAEEVEEEDGS